MPATSGKYFPETALGKVFIGSTAVAGVAIPISTGTAVTFGLWNTAPGKLAVPLRLGIGFTSGTIALGEFGIANQDVGFNVATGLPLAAATLGTPKNARLGEGDASAMKFIPGTATLTAGGTACLWLGSSITAATGAQPISNVVYDFDGGLIVPPGQLIFVCGSIAQTGIFTMSLTWAEIDA